MTPDTIGQELAREPFVPIRIFVSDGHAYDVRNPGLCLIFRGTMYIARIDRPSRITDDMDVIDCAHITRIEQIDEVSTQSSVPPGR